MGRPPLDSKVSWKRYDDAGMSCDDKRKWTLQDSNESHDKFPVWLMMSEKWGKEAPRQMSPYTWHKQTHTLSWHKEFFYLYFCRNTSSWRGNLLLWFTYWRCCSAGASLQLHTFSEATFSPFIITNVEKMGSRLNIGLHNHGQSNYANKTTAFHWYLY